MKTTESYRPLKRRILSGRAFTGTALALINMCAATPAFALDFTPFIGYRDGGEVVDSETDTKYDISGSNVYGFIIGSEPFDRGRTYELYYSHQSSEIRSINLPTSSVSATLPLSIQYLHAGGTAPISEEGPIRSFVSGGVGLTYMRPDADDLESELRASFSIGIGMEYPITEVIAARLEARGLLTLFNNNSTIFCSGGCTLTVNGNLFTQYEALAGITFSF